MNQLRRREEQSVHSRPAFVGRLAAATGIPAAEVEFLDLEESDSLAGAAFSCRNARPTSPGVKRGTARGSNVGGHRF